MRISLTSSIAASLLCFGSLARAQNASSNATTYAAGLISALQENNLTTLLSIAQANVDTLLPLLMDSGNLTVFAPTNDAFAALPSNVTSNDTLVAQTVLYHIYYGSFASSDLTEGLTIARSALNATGVVNLPGGQGQVGVLTMGSSEDEVTVVQALENVTSVASTSYQNLVVHVVPSVLSVPESLTATASAAGLTSLVSALTENAEAVVPALDSTRGITVFAPVNDAFTAAQDVITTLNQSTIANVLLNHVINGTAVYSSEVADGASLISAGGANLTFTANSTGVFVTSGDSTARIIRTDIPVANGVVHLIDSVLANPESNPGAASSAASSADAAASTATAQPTGAVGGGGASESRTATGSAPSGSATEPASGAEKVAIGGVLGAAFAVAGMLVL